VNLSPLDATPTLDAYYLEARSKLLDLAAILDRIGRGANGDEVEERDDRYKRIREALRILGDGEPDRAERVQMLFSLPYDAGWKRPMPR
jgi:hypothetical protein